ncbi:MAG: T9SS type A sorting domain-containing protein [Bacteroidales bacterium]|nr:T9SS type A sorting domain-containing protein [Bacteroidales bacterium]
MKTSTFLAIFLMTVVAVFAQENFAEYQKVCASDREAQDKYGASIDADGDWLISGAFHEDHDVNNSNYLEDAGSAYFQRNVNGTWVDFQKIVAPDRGSLDEFGTSVAISGNYAVVGSPLEDEDASNANTLGQAGSAYVYYFDGSAWIFQQKLVASTRATSRQFGYSVAIDDQTIVVGTNFGNDKVYVFEFDGNVWSETHILSATNPEISDYFGASVDIDGNYIAVGCPGDRQDLSEANVLTQAGSVYVYRKAAGSWSLDEKVVATDRHANVNYGQSVSIYGFLLIVGAPFDDYDATGSNSLMNAGSAYIYQMLSNTWTLKNKLVASEREVNDQFGTDVSINGDYASVTAILEDEDENDANTVSNSGSAYLFYNNLGNWEQAQKLVPANRYAYGFGEKTCLLDDYLMVSSSNNGYDQYDQNLLANTGAIYIFTSLAFYTLQPDNAAGICGGDDAMFYIEGSNYSSLAWYYSTDGGSTFNFCVQPSTWYEVDVNNTLTIHTEAAYNEYLFVARIYGSEVVYSDTVGLYLETQAPNFTDLDATIYLDESGAASLSSEMVVSGASDNCALGDTVLSQTIFDCSNVGANTVYVSLYDVSGNFITREVEVTVIDNIAPALTTENITVYLDEMGAASIMPADLVSHASDNCTLSDTTLSQTDFACSHLGTQSITVTLNDDNGNSVSEVATVDVLDTISPIIYCPNSTNVQVEASTYTVVDYEFDLQAWNENCSIASMTNNLNGTESLAGYALPSGVNNIVWTMIDGSGNTSSCSFTVNVDDVTGIKNLNAEAIKLYPNPAHDYLIISIPESIEANIQMLDIAGSLVKEFQLKSSETRISLNDVHNGVYFININGSTYKFIKQ